MPPEQRSSYRKTKLFRRSARGEVTTYLVALYVALGGLGWAIDSAADCAGCHAGIEPIADGRMGQQIRRLGKRYGDVAGCVVCHGGDPMANNETASHRGAPGALADAGGPVRFYPNPGATPIAERTCGQCHEGYAERWRKSVMSTEAEHIQRNLCEPAWQTRMLRGDALKLFGRYAIEDDDGPEPIAGTSTYKTWMKSAARGLPDRYPTRLYPIPTSVARQEGDKLPTTCEDCHSEPQPAGRGTGCSACHIPYRRGGTYQGADPTVPKTLPDRLLLHRIQGTGNTRVDLPARPAQPWRGIPLENCFRCHFDPRNLGVSEQGAIHAHYAGALRQSSRGLLCQDCHTSIEMHGDGNLAGANSAQREVRCEDCHGTTDRFPWELPLGYEGPDAGGASNGGSRGLASEPIDIPGKRYRAKDGYLLTSRGNPFGNVVKNGDRVVLHSASGRIYEVALLKQRAQQNTWRSELGRQVKSVGSRHAGMACTECHADWAPPCYGCHANPTSIKDPEDK